MHTLKPDSLKTTQFGGIECCPFCGVKETKIFEYGVGTDDHEAFVQCQNCTATGPSAHSKQDAVYRWNLLHLTDR